LDFGFRRVRFNIYPIIPGENVASVFITKKIPEIRDQGKDRKYRWGYFVVVIFEAFQSGCFHLYGVHGGLS
jgi:hypothetical protein